MAKVKVEIHQLIDNEDTFWKAFMSYEATVRKYGKINPTQYQKVYECEREDYDATLDGIYEEFNIRHPEDYKAHSLSVSDVIVRTDESGATAYYVNDFGFKDVTDVFIKKE